ncbi:hypothetical protein K2173_020191 [Erythroxylum novogranatense]|uniref:Uncharacterized protein n=1 Tax=Erythroxylum novogranatense TaxID=1862640 RepID=A0AAV8U762_9ROSI|nr:hypothetical protein K2173_020191 [Erythroxylum novogranatense]
MLKELLHLKWQERATKFSYEDTGAKKGETQKGVPSLEDASELFVSLLSGVVSVESQEDIANSSDRERFRKCYDCEHSL